MLNKKELLESFQKILEDFDEFTYNIKYNNSNNVIIEKIHIGTINGEYEIRIIFEGTRYDTILVASSPVLEESLTIAMKNIDSIFKCKECCYMCIVKEPENDYADEFDEGDKDDKDDKDEDKRVEKKIKLIHQNMENAHIKNLLICSGCAILYHFKTVDQDCLICKETSGGNIHSCVQCKVQIHKRCLREWFQTCKNRLCPACKKYTEEDLE